MDLDMKQSEAKPNADCQSRSPMLSTSEEPSSSPWGQASPTGATAAVGGKRGWWGLARPMGAVSLRPDARARQHQTLGKPPGQIPSKQKVCHTLKVGSRLSPDTVWGCFRPGESLREAASDLYGLAMAQRKTTTVIRQNWILRKERVLKSTTMWARRRRKSTM